MKDKLSDEQQGKLRLAVDALTDAMCAILSEACLKRASLLT